jgi:hypothetical protein
MGNARNKELSHRSIRLVEKVSRLEYEVLIRRIPAAAPLLFMVAAPSFAQSLPPVQATTLDGAPVVLPGEGRTKPLVLLLGFSHKSDGDFKSWAERARTPYLSDSRVDYYELVDLQGVPSIIDVMIVHGMRRAVKEPRRSHFAPFYHHETDWKKLVNYDDPKVAYAVLADAEGHVVWQSSGPATDAKALELESMITKLSGRSSPVRATSANH